MFKYSKYIFLALFLTLLISQSVSAETPAGSTIESRATLAFNVNDQGAQALLPEGWKLFTLPKGPFAGANLLVAFIDRHLSIDQEGKTLTPYWSRAVAFISYGVKKGVKGARVFVVQVYETPPPANPYSNSELASISRRITVDGQSDGTRTQQESWSVRPESGGEITLNLSFQPGKPGWKPSKSMPYSNVNPDFYRIYKYEQLTNLAISKKLGISLNGNVTFQSDIAKHATIFDGSEELVGMLTVPVYIREVFLP